jgi:PTS system mannose-specific IID component
MSQQQAAEKRSITRNDVFQSFLRWLFFSHANYNWERYQGTGFAHAMTPIIKKLYQDPADIKAALKRHLVFFNTEPDTGGVIHGMVIAMEEQRALGVADMDDETINNVKFGLMGPFAGLGDTLKQGMWFPIFQSIGISVAVAAEGGGAGILGPIIYLLAAFVYTYAFGWWVYWQGYVRGQSLVTQMLGTGLLDDIRTGAAVLGAAVLGALGAQFVTVATGLKLTITSGSGDEAVTQVFSFQSDLFNALFPSLLPLLTILALIWLLRRGVSPVELVLYLFGIAFGSALVESVARYAIQENSIIGVISSGGIPTLIGIVIFVAAAYYAGYRRNATTAAIRFIVGFLVVAIVAAVLVVVTDLFPDGIQLLAHF